MTEHGKAFEIIAASLKEERVLRAKLQEQLDEALLKIELLEAIIHDLNQRIAFLES